MICLLPEGTLPKSAYNTPSNYELQPKGTEDSTDRYDRDKGPPNQPKLESPRRRKNKNKKKGNNKMDMGFKKDVDEVMGDNEEARKAEEARMN